MSVIKCHSTLKVPDWRVAHKEKLAILHASFADYLKDPSRSGEFYLGSDDDVDDDVRSCLLTIWNKCSEGDMGTGTCGVSVFIANVDVLSTLVSVEAAWHQCCSKWDDRSPSRAITRFYANLFPDVVFCISSMIQYRFKRHADSRIYAQLYDVNMIKLSYYMDGGDVAGVVDALVVKHLLFLTRI
jgi:hypothetical protein